MRTSAPPERSKSDKHTLMGNELRHLTMAKQRKKNIHGVSVVGNGTGKVLQRDERSACYAVR
jgi:hypothetical protein